MKSYITSIGTAVPAFRTPQNKIVDFMSAAAQMDAEEKNTLVSLYRASGISYRYSVIPDFGESNGNYQFFPNTIDLEPFPSVTERMELYEKEALPLAMKAVKNCFSGQQKYQYSDVTHLITVSCSGMYAPGLDIELVEKLSLNKNVQRTCINFMGCYAAFNGLKIADAICRSDKQARVLLVCVELCTIHYQKTKEWDQLLSNALFSDGAAAVLIDQEKPTNGVALSLESFHCDLASEGKKDMAWHINEKGFEMTLSSYVPELIRNGIEKLTLDLLQKFGLTSNEIDFFAIHPGGKKIIEAIESVLKIEKYKNRFAHDVLRNYGNMSSPTVLFVLKEIIDQLSPSDHRKNILSFAFGPGLTLESMLLGVYSQFSSEVEISISDKEAVVIS